MNCISIAFQITHKSKKQNKNAILVNRTDSEEDLRRTVHSIRLYCNKFISQTKCYRKSVIWVADFIFIFKKARWLEKKRKKKIFSKQTFPPIFFLKEYCLSSFLFFFSQYRLMGCLTFYLEGEKIIKYKQTNKQKATLTVTWLSAPHLYRRCLVSTFIHYEAVCITKE